MTYIDDYITSLQQAKKLPDIIPMDYEQAMKTIIKIGKSLSKNGEFRIDENNEDIFKNLVKYVHNDPGFEGDLNKGIFLYGVCGVGKTLMMSAFVHYVNMMSAVKEGFRKCMEYTAKEIAIEYSEEGIKILRDYCKPEILIQDLGYEGDDKMEVIHFGQRVQPLAELISYRNDMMDRGLYRTHITSNLNHENIEQIYSVREWSRAKEMVNFIEMKGHDRR